MKLRRISATLGPTNTGKTFSAIKKLLHYNSGVIGFPLRLLARENYELVKNQVTGFRRSNEWATNQYIYFVAQFSKEFNKLSIHFPSL